MWEAISKLIGLVPTLIRELPIAQRRVVVLGIFTAILVIVACWLINWRLTTDVPATAIVGPLAIMLDVKLVMFGIASVAVILVWLMALVRSVYRGR